MNRFLFMLLLSLPLMLAAQTSSVQISWVYDNVEKGYDHDSKCLIYVDGEQVGESSVTPETKPNSYKIAVDRGKHNIRVESWTLYEGKWEMHTVENDYSVDALYEGTHRLSKGKHKLSIVFDIDNGTEGKFK
ncbi:MAG: hypothetical protein SF053_01545 [Bacteroidia bacterium]|nr:hypothetical protein [Bacteroidia bacterium]